MIALVAGFGCRRGCPVEVLAALLDQTLHANGLDRERLVGIASHDHKADEPGLVQLAAQLEVPLRTFNAPTLQVYEQQLSHRSKTAYEHTGCYGVAESSALALALAVGEPHPTLLVKRQHTREATLALAGVTAAL